MKTIRLPLVLSIWVCACGSGVDASGDVELPEEPVSATTDSSDDMAQTVVEASSDEPEEEQVMESLAQPEEVSSPVPSVDEMLDGVSVEEVLAAHNAVRDSLDVGLSPLRWSDELAVVAQEWAELLVSDCGGPIFHRMSSPYGENIAQRSSFGFGFSMTIEDSVDGWAAEDACWSFGTIRGTESCNNSCVANLNSTGCGHYTQIVWDRTESVGCGYATCERSDGWLGEVWVCNYDPPGNIVGQAPY